MIEGLSHMTFIVRDLNKMEEMLTQVLDAKKIYDSGDRMFSLSKERFSDIGGLWIATMEGDPLKSRTYNHVAFKIRQDEYDDRLQHIRALGLDVKEGRSRVEGHLIYFYDYDNHMFELHSGTLQERLVRYRSAPPTGSSWEIYSITPQICLRTPALRIRYLQHSTGSDSHTCWLSQNLEYVRRRSL